MSRRDQIYSKISLSFLLLLVILFTRPGCSYSYIPNFQSPPDYIDDLQTEYGTVIAVELGEVSRVAVMDKGVYVLLVNDRGERTTSSCINEICLIRPEMNYEIATELFKDLKNTAEGYLAEKVTHAVTSVPTYFNDTQRQFIKDAASAAGLHVLRLVDEPKAAVIGHNIDKVDGERNFLVFNLNSKTFDVALDNVDMGVIETLAHTSGKIGSQDLEEATLDLFLGNMRIQIPEAERILATKKSTTIQQKVTQEDLQRAYRSIFEQTVPMIDKVMKEAKAASKEEALILDGIVLTGNVEHIAKLEPFIEAYLGTKVYKVVQSDEAIIRGLAQQAGVLSGDEGWEGCTLSMDVNPLSIGVNVGGIFRKVIPRNTVIPTRKGVTITTVYDEQISIIVDIIEGERLISSKNQLLGTLELPIPPATGGVPRVEVDFEFDANGHLKVTAELKSEQGLCVDGGIWEGEECVAYGKEGRDTNGLSTPATECNKIEKCGKVELLLKDVTHRYSYEEYDRIVMEAEGSVVIDSEEKDTIEKYFEPGEREFRVIEAVREPWVESQNNWMTLSRRIGQWLGWWGYDMPNDVHFHHEF